MRRPAQVLAFTLLVATSAPGELRAGTATVVYTYDLVGRVATALYDNGTCITYTYDANGNRTSQTNSVGGSGPQTPTWDTGTWGCFAWTMAHEFRALADGDVPWPKQMRDRRFDARPLMAAARAWAAAPTGDEAQR